jgi:hypothetical protein
VAQPVGGDLLGGDPREVLTKPGPEMIVAAGRNRPAIGITEQLPLARGVPCISVLLQVCQESR